MPAPRVPQAPSIRSAQIILGALIGGVLMFAAAASVIELASPVDANVARMLLIGVAVLAGAGIVTYVFFRREALRRLGLRRDQALEEARSGTMPAELMALTLVGAALAESVGLLGCVIVLLTRFFPVLVLPGLAILLIAAQLPSQARVEGLVRDAVKESH